MERTDGGKSTGLIEVLSIEVRFETQRRIRQILGFVYCRGTRLHDAPTSSLGIDFLGDLSIKVQSAKL